MAGMYKEVCKTCGWSLSGQDGDALKTALAKHVIDEHESLAEKHKNLLTDVVTFIDKIENGTKKPTKKEMRELRNRVSAEICVEPEPETESEEAEEAETETETATEDAPKGKKNGKK